MKMQENEKKGCLIGLSCMIPGIVCWIIGQEFDIYVLIVLGYGAFPYAGSLYAQYVSKDKTKRWSVRTHAFYIVSYLIVAIVFTLIGYGKLW